VDRLACVEIPALPLQILLDRHPRWAERAAAPIVVVEHDRPQSPILWVNKEARECGIRSGMRYAAALSLAPELLADTVQPEIIQVCVDCLVERFQRFTPRVEASENELGTFWLDASGLVGLFSSLSDWAHRLSVDLLEANFHAVVVIGFSRFGTYAVAKDLSVAHADHQVVVFSDPARETFAAQRVRLDRLDIEPFARDLLHKLGISTVAALVALPTSGLAERFGVRVYDLHQQATGQRRVLLAPRPLSEPVQARLDLDFPETDTTSLLLLVERLLAPLLSTLASRDQRLETLVLRRTLDRSGGKREDVIRLAAPTLNMDETLELVRLRFDSDPLPSGVVALTLRVRSTRAVSEQDSLFSVKPRRDPRAAERALARIRSELGNDAVQKARILDGHLPEAQFAWERLEKLAPATAVGNLSENMPRREILGGVRIGSKIGSRRLIRRIRSSPLPLPPLVGREMPGFLLRGISPGPFLHANGPYVIRGGWWTGKEVHREYRFIETQSGHLLWIFYDNRRRRWFFHGQVE